MARPSLVVIYPATAQEAKLKTGQQKER